MATKYAVFQFTKQQAQVAKFCAPDESRPMLAALQFNIAKGRVEAADGFRMIQMPLDEDMVTEGDVGSFLVRGKVFTRAVKALKSPQFTCRYTYDGEKQSLTLSDDQGVKVVIDEFIDGIFPDLDKIVEEKEFERAAHMSASFIKDIMAMGSSGDSDNMEFALSGSANSITRFTGKIQAEYPFTAYVMPMVVSGAD